MKRVLSALTLLPVVVAVILFLPPAATVALASVAALLALHEYAGLAAAFGARVFRGVAAAGVAATVAGAAYGAAAPVLLAALLAVGAASLSAGRGDRVLGDAAASAFPLLYIGLPLGAVAAVSTSAGPAAVLLLLGSIVASDTAQYYGGRWLGRTPLAAAVSPGKTVEGALFGLAAGAGVMAAAGFFAHAALSCRPALGALLGLVVAGLGIAGDLFESQLKRGAGVKDASTLIPGHGGMLDRIDSLLFAGPGFYLMLQLLYRVYR